LLPIGRIAERVTQAISEGSELGRRPPAIRVSYIDEFLLRLHADVDNPQAPLFQVGAYDTSRAKTGARVIAIPFEFRIASIYASALAKSRPGRFPFRWNRNGFWWNPPQK
jgi:hypothetical protein